MCLTFYPLCVSYLKLLPKHGTDLATAYNWQQLAPCKVKHDGISTISNHCAGSSPPPPRLWLWTNRRYLPGALDRPLLPPLAQPHITHLNRVGRQITNNGRAACRPSNRKISGQRPGQPTGFAEGAWAGSMLSRLVNRGRREKWIKRGKNERRVEETRNHMLKRKSKQTLFPLLLHPTCLHLQGDGGAGGSTGWLTYPTARVKSTTRAIDPGTILKLGGGGGGAKVKHIQHDARAVGIY